MHNLFVENVFIRKGRKEAIELKGGIHFQVSIELDIVPSMCPGPGILILFFNLLIHFHIFAIVEHEEEHY